MYLGSSLALAGVALFYESVSLLVYVGVFLLASNLFLLLYEEPTLRRIFGPEYESYCQRARR
jgi:protein-S-isoprenylcysteine O-methyltransferase Ste14